MNPLLDEFIKQRFLQWVRPQFDRVAPSIHPRVVLVGAQPGAGKTRVGRFAQEQYSNLVPVIGDDFRQLHPDYDELVATSPGKMPEITSPFSNRMVELSIDYLRSTRRNVLLETTLRQPAVVRDTLTRFKMAGFDTEIRALAVMPEVSLQGAVIRFLDDVRRSGEGRITPLSVHNEAVKMMPTTLEAIIKAECVDNIVVVNRGGLTLADVSVVDGITGHARVFAALDYGQNIVALATEERANWLRTQAELWAQCSPDMPVEIQESIRWLQAQKNKMTVGRPVSFQRYLVSRAVRKVRQTELSDGPETPPKSKHPRL